MKKQISQLQLPSPDDRDPHPRLLLDFCPGIINGDRDVLPE